MKENEIYILNPDNTKREIDWVELNQLKKDILWVFDENIGQINAAFVPSYSFNLNYWEYLTLDGDKSFNEEEKHFYKTGVLVILLCFCVEYNCLESGNQEVFIRQELPQVLDYVVNYTPKFESENKIKQKVIDGLNIALSLTTEQLNNTDFEHENLPEFINNINEIGDAYILNYYKSKVNVK